MKKSRKVSPTGVSAERPSKRAKKSNITPDTVFYDPKNTIVSLNRSPETKRRADALAYGRSQESTDVVDSRYLASEDTAPVSTCVDPGCSETTVTKPKTTQGFSGDKGRNMPESPLDRGCKEALVVSMGSSAASNASGTAHLLSPVAGVGTSQASGKPDSRALSTGLSATHPVVTAEPGHGSDVLAGRGVGATTLQRLARAMAW